VCCRQPCNHSGRNFRNVGKDGVGGSRGNVAQGDLERIGPEIVDAVRYVRNELIEFVKCGHWLFHRDRMRDAALLVTNHLHALRLGRLER